jgi:uncharacterized alpha-E superfamily protein
MPALVDLLVLDRDNPRSLGWVAQTLRGRLAKLEGTAAGEIPDIAQTVPDPKAGPWKPCARAMPRAATRHSSPSSNAAPARPGACRTR